MGVLYCICAVSKSVPTKWLHMFLHCVCHSVCKLPKIVLVDRGSELGHSTEVKSLIDFMVINLSLLVLIKAL